MGKNIHPHCQQTLLLKWLKVVTYLFSTISKFLYLWGWQRHLHKLPGRWIFIKKKKKSFVILKTQSWTWSYLTKPLILFFSTGSSIIFEESLAIKRTIVARRAFERHKSKKEKNTTRKSSLKGYYRNDLALKKLVVLLQVSLNSSRWLDRSYVKEFIERSKWKKKNTQMKEGDRAKQRIKERQANLLLGIENGVKGGVNACGRFE